MICPVWGSAWVTGSNGENKGLRLPLPVGHPERSAFDTIRGPWYTLFSRVKMPGPMVEVRED